MNSSHNLEPGQLPVNLQAIVAQIRALAKSEEGDTMALLALLRTLESLHREIRDGLFQESLPENRHQLYGLLKEIEAESGWPYIPRMRLQALLAGFGIESAIGGYQPSSRPPGRLDPKEENRWQQP